LEGSAINPETHTAVCKFSECSQRLAGKPTPDYLTRLSNHLWIGRNQLFRETEITLQHRKQAATNVLTTIMSASGQKLPSILHFTRAFRFGSKAGMAASYFEVRFTPENGHSTDSMLPKFQHAGNSTSIPAPPDTHKRPSAIFVLRKIAGGSGIDHTAVFQHIRAIGDVDRYAHVLFDQQY
jgi:hypothetical protein